MPIQKHFIVLGVNHRVQGDYTYDGTFEDSDYVDLLTNMVCSNDIDFVGEECTPNPTHAKRIAREKIGEGHYLNVDPLMGAEREQLGIGNTGGMLTFQSPSDGKYAVCYEIVSEQEKREGIWVDRLIERTAVNGLLICGHLHVLSVAFNLRKRGFEVEARIYLPLRKLCGHLEGTGGSG